jgi:hypothetical protein
MRLAICLTAALALCACQKQAETTDNNATAEANATDMNAAEVNAATPAATPAAFQLDETTWTYADPMKKVPAQESIDANGNYIENAVSGTHIDHGTAVMKGDKACFTSAMTKEGEVCWTTKPTEVGQSMDTVSDKGQKLTVMRVAYVPMTMPK